MKEVTAMRAIWSVCLIRNRNLNQPAHRCALISTAVCIFIMHVLTLAMTENLLYFSNDGKFTERFGSVLCACCNIYCTLATTGNSLNGSAACYVPAVKLTVL